MYARGSLFVIARAVFLLFGTGILFACTPCGDNEELLSIPVGSATPVVGEELKYYKEQLAKYNSTENIAHIVPHLLGDRYSGAKSSVFFIRENIKNEHILYDIVLIFDDVPDSDSSSGYHYDIQLKLADEKYEIVEMKESWRCWPDRGHRIFSVEPCE